MRQISQSPSSSSPLPQPHRTNHLPPPVAAAAATAAFSLLLFLVVCFRKITRKRTAPETHSKPPHRLSYSVLKRATDSFSPARRLGQGGFGSVFLGTLPHTRQEVAVKLMDSGSLQGEREFQNELFLASKLSSPLVVSVFGFSSDPKRRRMLLVYEFMSNGNLQDALLHRKCPELMEWRKRLSIGVDIAKGLRYLHGLDPPVVHGDVKPSNVLLDRGFRVKIADFGLAREKTKSQVVVEIGDDVDGGKKEVEVDSVVEETDSVATTGYEDLNNAESLVKLPPVSPDTSLTSASPMSLEGGLEEWEGGKERGNRDWWWRQDSGAVKDYVMEWIGKEIGTDWPVGAAASSSGEVVGSCEKKGKKRNGKRLEWWVSMDEEKKAKKAKNLSKEKRRPAREWWKEEYCDELSKKKKKRKDKKQPKGMSFDENEDHWWPHDEELYVESKKKKKKNSRSKSWGSMSSIDWWLDGMRGNTGRDSGEIAKSGGISSTPSMRGTVCYVAPEYGYGGDPSEKCDVYSFGVLLLVLIAGRRPLQVTNSPLSEFQKANLLSWARHLARAGKLIDLADKSIQSLDREQAILCITVALVCLQKVPSRRPSMEEVVGMLTGELEPPKLPPELTTSAKSRFPFKSHTKKGPVSF